jgi:hypothetical protein
LTREDVVNIEVSADEPRKVTVEFTKEGRAKIGKLTDGWNEKRLAVLVNGRIVFTPIVKSADARQIDKTLLPK